MQQTVIIDERYFNTISGEPVKTQHIEETIDRILIAICLQTQPNFEYSFTVAVHHDHVLLVVRSATQPEDKEKLDTVYFMEDEALEF